MTPAARRATVLTAALGGWTVFEWVTRIGNAARDHTLDGGEKAFAVGSAVLFTGLGVAALVVAWRSRPAGVDRRALPFVGLFAAFTTLWWVVRSVLVWAHEHDTGFKVVHTVLAVISVTLSVLAARAVAASSGDDGVEGEGQAPAAAARL